MACLTEPPADVIVFLLDDMRADQLEPLPETLSRLSDQAVIFDRAYVTTPLCCPVGASFLTGGYPARQTGVLANQSPSGSATVFTDGRTLATRLREVGYFTALNGKYMNGYEEMGTYVPPGWSDWAAVPEGGSWNDPSFILGSSTADAAADGASRTFSGYLSDLQGSSALRTLDAAGDAPLFLYVSFLAPHHPHVPADEDAGSYADFLYRGGAYEEADVSDKPAWIQDIPLLTEAETAEADASNQERLECLGSVDRAMAEVIDAVRAAGREDRTVFVLSSDNGQLWREHRMSGKGVGYEESVRVPLLIANPALTARHSDALIAMDLDVPATLAALTGLSAEGEGRDLSGLLCGETETGRDHVLFESWGGDQPTWSGLVTDTEKYIETAGGEIEYYDLSTDPLEERSAHLDPGHASRISALAATLDAERGLAISTAALPEGAVGAPYAASMSRWGGEGSVSWSLRKGPLPDGLTLSADGLLSGTPTETGAFDLVITATDSGVSPIHGGPQVATEGLTLTVGPEIASAEGGCGCGGSSKAGAPLIGLGMLALRRRLRLKFA